MNTRAVSYVTFLALVAMGLSFAAFASADSREDRVPGQYIVVFNDSVSSEDSAAAENDLISRAGAMRLDSYRHALRGFSAQLSPAGLRAVKNDPRVAFVSEDRIVSIARDEREAPRRITAEFEVVESDVASAISAPRSESHRTRRPPPPPPVPTQTLPTGVDRINAEGKANTGAGVQVAVIDTGIDLSHPDLKANILGGRNCTTSNPSDYGDKNGHGTHVAGTIAALNNSEGVVGVAPGAKLWAVRVLDKNGYGTWSSVICGLDIVAANGPANGGSIKVANMSLGGGGVSDDDCGNTNNDALHKAVCRVRDAGVTLVVAAGNDGMNSSGFVPAAYDDAVITVSALADSDGKLGGLGAATSWGTDDTFASFSNFGSVVDIGAPGVSINSTWIGGIYKSISGTSMASPHVAGAAALYIATYPGASWTMVRDALIGLGEAAGAGHTDPSLNHPENVLRADAL